MLENNNLSCIAHNQSSVTILNHFVYELHTHTHTHTHAHTHTHIHTHAHTHTHTHTHTYTHTYEGFSRPRFSLTIRGLW